MKDKQKIFIYSRIPPSLGNIGLENTTECNPLVMFRVRIDTLVYLLTKPQVKTPTTKEQPRNFDCCEKGGKKIAQKTNFSILFLIYTSSFYYMRSDGEVVFTPA
jgi:hypothetical protein